MRTRCAWHQPLYHLRVCSCLDLPVESERVGAAKLNEPHLLRSQPPASVVIVELHVTIQVLACRMSTSEEIELFTCRIMGSESYHPLLPVRERGIRYHRAEARRQPHTPRIKRFPQPLPHSLEGPRTPLLVNQCDCTRAPRRAFPSTGNRRASWRRGGSRGSRLRRRHRITTSIAKWDETATRSEAEASSRSRRRRRREMVGTWKRTRRKISVRVVRLDLSVTRE